jgi:hypothetical protein
MANFALVRLTTLQKFPPYYILNHPTLISEPETPNLSLVFQQPQNEPI